MNLSRSACLVLGAAAGVASVYLLRRLLFSTSKDRPSDKKDADKVIRPKILINGLEQNKTSRTRERRFRCARRLRDRIIPSIVQNVQMEFSKMCDRDVWKIIIPTEKSPSSSSVFYDARAELSPNIIDQRNWLNCHDYETTEYRSLPSSLPSSLPDSQNSDNILHTEDKENACKSMAQSTMIESNNDKSPLKIPIWDRTLRELIALNRTSISDDCKDVEVVVRINRSRSPIKHFYKKVTNFIKTKTNLNENI